ncbi:lipopolysaccharide assembly protein LapA domain-containing protein [Arenimonas sp.]|uniref:lipopolysaccharide assembly protein LapA domain-containing protein n=1 Tax=Arenimonas sp. TaxID=1872635 RepID=UPI0035B21A7E
MRLIKALLALLFVAFGVLFGALNRDPVSIDLGLWQVQALSLGTSLLLAVLAGAVLAGFVLTASVIWPLRHRLRRDKPVEQVPAPGPGTHD